MVMGALALPRAGESPGSIALRRASALSMAGSARPGPAAPSAGTPAGGGGDAAGAAGVPPGAAAGARASRGTLGRALRASGVTAARSLATGASGVSRPPHHSAAPPTAAAVTATPASFQPPANLGRRALVTAAAPAPTPVVKPPGAPAGPAARAASGASSARQRCRAS
jgi:hypothetical protein